MTYAATTLGGGPYAGTLPTTASTPTASTLARGVIDVWISFDGDPFDAPTWTRVTDDIEPAQRWEIDRGRSNELEAPRAGTFAFTLRSINRRYDPTYTAGPFYGRLKPRRPVLVTATVGAVTYSLGVFYIPRWPQRFDARNSTATFVPIVAVDLFGLLANVDWRPARPFTINDADLGQTNADNVVVNARPWRPAEPTGPRIRALLERAGVPANLIEVDRGQSRCAAGRPTKDRIGDELDLLAWTELGDLFVNATGVLTMIGRHGWSRRLAMRTPQLVLSDDLTDPDLGPYMRLAWDAEDVRRVVNEVTFRLPDGTDATARNGESRRTYGPVTVQRDTAHASRTTARRLARWWCDRFANAETRFEDVVLDPATNTGVLWPAVAGFDLGTCVEVRHQPAGIGDELVETCRITGIRHTLRQGFNLETTWRLSKADPTRWFTINDPAYGQTNADNRVAP